MADDGFLNWGQSHFINHISWSGVSKLERRNEDYGLWIPHRLDGEVRLLWKTLWGAPSEERNFGTTSRI